MFLHCFSLSTLDVLEKVHKEKNFPLLYSSDTYGDDLPYWVPRPNKEGVGNGLLMIPYTLDNNDVKFGLANGFGSPDGKKFDFRFSIPLLRPL